MSAAPQWRSVLHIAAATAGSARPWPRDDRVVTEPKADLARDIVAMLEQCIATSVIPLRTALSLAGKLNNAAWLLTAWRPSLSESWACIAGGPMYAQRCIWRRQIEPALWLFNAFLRSFRHTLRRRFKPDVHRAWAEDMAIETEGRLGASAWSL